MLCQQKLRTKLWGFATNNKKLEIKGKPFWNLIESLVKVGGKTTHKGKVYTIRNQRVFGSDMHASESRVYV